MLNIYDYCLDMKVFLSVLFNILDYMQKFSSFVYNASMVTKFFS